MSTKKSEACPQCKTETNPIDFPVAFDAEYGTFPVRLWRFKCECGWVWANELQRKHNDHEYYRSKKLARARIYQDF